MKAFLHMVAVLASSAFLCQPFVAIADEALTIATWNVAFIDRTANDLDLASFAEEVDFDILIVNEIKRASDLDRLKEEMGREDFATAVSSFDPGDRGLEVGIISRYPIGEAIEYDRSVDNSGNVEERRLERVDTNGIADVGVGRGFLVVEIPQQQLYVIATHLKSSRGRSGEGDRTNAQKRELVAAAISEEVLRLREANPEYTVVVGGDINVGVTDNDKNGIDLENDSTDGYDDTHAIFELGLINGLQMRSLAKNVGETFVSDRFPGTGAIDALYVIGAAQDEFSEARATSSSFGSDHLAVYASTGDAVAPAPVPVTPISTNNSIEIANALPNPVGEDRGRERITIANFSDEVIDISGWTLRDRANNSYSFPPETVLVSGDNEFTLPPGAVPLNNDGDSIELLNPNGEVVGLAFVYSRSDVRVGLPVRR